MDKKKPGLPEKILYLSETDEEKNMNDQELKKKSKEFAQSNFQGKKYFNSSAGKEILVSADGIGKWHNITKSRDQGLSIKKLDEMLKFAIRVDGSTDEKNRHSVDGFTYFEQLIFVNNNLYKAKIATKETHGNESKYYYHFLEVRTDDKKNKPN